MFSDKIGSYEIISAHECEEVEMAEDGKRKRVSLKMLREKAIEEGKPIFRKLAENDKAVAVLMLFPDGNVRIKLVTKGSYTKTHYLNIKEPEEITALIEILEDLAGRKQLLNLLKENEDAI